MTDYRSGSGQGSNQASSRQSSYRGPRPESSGTMASGTSPNSRSSYNTRRPSRVSSYASASPAGRSSRGTRSTSAGAASPGRPPVSGRSADVRTGAVMQTRRGPGASAGVGTGRGAVERGVGAGTRRVAATGSGVAGTRATQGRRPVQPSRGRRIGSGGGSNMLNRRQFSKGMVVAGAAGVAVIAGGGIMISRRAVACEINGAQCQATNHSSIQSLIDKGLVKPKYGNLVDVTGEILEVGKGNRYTVSVNGADLGADIDKYRLKSGDKLIFTDGTDLMEEHDAQRTEIPFKWVRKHGAGAIGFIENWGKPGYSELLVGKQSGKTVNKDVAEAPEDRTIRYLNVEPKNGEKIVAISFDDGPTPEYTPRVLEILKQYNAKATFFDIGRSIQAHPQITKQCVDEGHVVGCHTQTHKNLPNESAETVKSEIAQSMEHLHATGSQSKLFRAPYGAFGDREWTILQSDISCLCGWNLDSQDWNVRKTTPASIVKSTTTNMRPGTIILCHAGGGPREHTVQALPEILKAWTEAGYKFVTIPELLASDDRFPQAVVKDAVAAPESQPQDDTVTQESKASAAASAEKKKQA